MELKDNVIYEKRRNENISKKEHTELKSEQINEIDSDFEKKRIDRKIEQIKAKIATTSVSVHDTEFALAEMYKKVKEKQSTKKPGVFNRLQSALSTDLMFKYIYKRFPEVIEGNNPDSENFYLKKVDVYNSEQELRAEQLGFKEKIAFMGHMHSRGVDNVLDGSDGSLTPEEILEEYKKAVKILKEKGYADVYIVLTDHNSVNNSIKLAELMEKEGVAKPIVGVESTTKEGYEILSYTTDIKKLKKYNQYIEKKIGIFLRNAKSNNKGEDLISRLASDDFVIGMPHPAAQKAIMLGGDLRKRMDNDSRFREMIRDKVVFYEGMNWFQDVKGSNCIAFAMRERMEEMNVIAFSNEDFHSKASGNEETFFNGMFTEIRTDAKIQSGEDLLNLFRAQKKDDSNPKYLTLMRGVPATDNQYKEQLGTASKQNIKNIIRCIWEKIKFDT